MEVSETEKFLLLTVLILAVLGVGHAGKTSPFIRKLEASDDMPLNADVFEPPPGQNAPQRVHITQGDHVGQAVIVSWITPKSHGSRSVLYGPEASKFQYKAEATVKTYRFYNYTSGFIHHSIIDGLKFNTKYYYKIGGESSAREFSFTTPPPPGPDVQYKFGIIGKYTPQYMWLEKEFTKVNRSETPWLIVIMHCPWYNSNSYHYREGETMRVQFESWFIKYKVDVVFAGHVHAYERSKRVSNIGYNIVNGNCTPVHNPSAPVYITIGDGGNIEGLAANFTEPQPDYSVFREASFGFALFDIKNRTHAYYQWHRNQDRYSKIADSQWFYNRHWYAVEEPNAE